MRGYLAFTKKEFLEQVRTFKWLIVLSVFFVFGMMSPLSAKLLPEILSGMEMNGVTIIAPDPVVTDAYGQFFKNTTQMGVLVLLLVFGGTVSNEFMKGTLVNILAKGLPRPTVMLSKYTAAVTLWTMGYVLAALTNYGYTLYLFENASVDNLLFSLFCLWLFGCFLLALVFLSSTLAGGNFGGLILSATGLVIMLMVNILPGAAKFNPITLASKNVDLIMGTQDPGGLYITIGITCALTVLSLVCSILLFGRKKI